MANPFQEQLLKAGLVSKQKVQRLKRKSVETEKQKLMTAVTH